MGVQSTYTQSMTKAFAGMLADDGAHDVWAMTNNEASAEIAFGRGVRFGGVSGADKSAKLPAAETDKVAGIVMHSHAYSNSPNGDLGSTGLKVGAVMNVLRKGRIWAIAEDGCAPGDRLWLRCTVGGDAAEVLGSTGNADEGTETIDCTAQGQWVTTAAAGGLAVLEVDFTNI